MQTALTAKPNVRERTKKCKSRQLYRCCNLKRLPYSKEQSGAKEKADTEYEAATRQADEEKQQKSEEQTTVSMLQSEEINLSKEQSEAKEKADTEYEAAIRQADEEN